MVSKPERKYSVRNIGAADKQQALNYNLGAIIIRDYKNKRGNRAL